MGFLFEAAVDQLYAMDNASGLLEIWRRPVEAESL